MLRRVVLVRTDFSWEPIASIIMVERIRELGTTSNDIVSGFFAVTDCWLLLTLFQARWFSP
jgi:hypothetical protein